MARSPAPQPPSGPLAPATQRFLHWLAEALAHAMGHVPPEQALAPPLVGVQPYRHSPSQRWL